MKKAIDDPNLDVSADHVLILRNAGPQARTGHAGMGHAADPDKSW